MWNRAQHPGLGRVINLLQEGRFKEEYGGWVRMDTRGPLLLLNYTQKAMFKGHWDDVIKCCRGLIIDSRDWSVAALPFPKFFNLGEHDQYDIPLSQDFRVFEKVDGSLGIYYRMGNEGPALATRGSFSSPHAKEGTELLHKLKTDLIPNNWTPLFEIISPATHNVVKYTQPELVLLGAYDRYTKTEIAWRNVVELAKDIGCRTAAEFHISDLTEAEARANMFHGREGEGFVIRFDNGMRVKLKSGSYFEIARALSRYSERNLVDLLRSGNTPEQVYSMMPDEVHELLDKDLDHLLKWWNELGRKVDMWFNYAEQVVESVPLAEKRKKFVLYLQEELKKHEKPELMHPIFSGCMTKFDGKEPDWWDYIRKNIANTEHPIRERIVEAGDY